MNIQNSPKTDRRHEQRTISPDEFIQSLLENYSLENGRRKISSLGQQRTTVKKTFHVLKVVAKHSTTLQKGCDQWHHSPKEIIYAFQPPMRIQEIKEQCPQSPKLD